MIKVRKLLTLFSASFCLLAGLSACNKKGAVKVYDVVFDTQGGSVVETQKVKHGEKATKPADPSKTDYVFQGWFEDSVAVTPFDFDIEITANWTIYAGWKVDQGGGGGGGHSGSLDPITTGAAAKVGSYYYELTSYVDDSSPVNAWKNEDVDGEDNDEVVFYVDGTVISVFSDGSSSDNNITEEHPMSQPVQSVHLKKGGNFAIYFKQWSDAYTFWITTPDGGVTPPPVGEDYVLSVEIASDFSTAYHEAGAVTYVYAFNQSANEWLNAEGGSVNIDKQYTSFIVVRMNPANPGDWSGKWNQTADITIDTSKTKVTITGWGSGTLAYTYE